MSSPSRPLHVLWMLISRYQQYLAWRDAAHMRTARIRAETQAQQQLQAMLHANPSGQLGHAVLDDETALRKSGLIE